MTTPTQEKDRSIPKSILHTFHCSTEEHQGEFERNWSFMRATISNRNFPENLKGDGKWYNFNGVILLTSLPSFYASLVESLRLNDKYRKPAILRTTTPESERRTSRTTRHSGGKPKWTPADPGKTPLSSKQRKTSLGELSTPQNNVGIVRGSRSGEE